MKKFFCSVKNWLNENKKRKIVIGLLIIIILFLLLHSCNKISNKDNYDIKKDPKVNMITINNIIVTSNVCDGKWIKKTNKLIKKLEKDSKAIKKIKTDDKKYQKKLDEFVILQNEVKKNLKEMLDFIETNETLNKETLVDNITLTYNAYKNYYVKFLNKKAGGK
jgi:hypothetical protein